MKRAAAFAAAIAATLALAGAACAGPKLESIGGHVGVGGAKLFVSDAPGGSLSASAGLDVPLLPDWRIGLDLGFHLLGGRNVERGSLAASVDYSQVDLLLMTHWQPKGLGPVGRVSFGPGIVHGNAEVSASGAAVAFEDLARGENALGFGLDATLMSKRPMPVRVGLELSSRLGLLDEETWTLFGARLVFHF